MKLKTTLRCLLAGAALGMTGLSAHAQDKTLTLCWAAWDPANALVELSKDFTAKTGINMKYEFVPWPNFAQRMLNELNSKGKLCDLLIGDSQWIGSAATEGHYIKLNEFFDRNGIKMGDFMPATVEGYSTWPKGSKNYWALPAMGDAVAFTYRKDWFARPELRAEFKQKFNRDLAPPTTWDEFRQVAQFFQNRNVDGKKVYGAALYTERGSEGITMGVTNTLYAYGFDYQNPAKAYDMKGFVNSPGAVKGLKLYKELYDTVTPPGHSNAYMTENLDAYKSGQVAMQMNFIAFFPGISKDPAVGGEKTGFFPIPKGDKHFAQLGGQGISVVKYSDKKDMALEYLKWFAQPTVQKKWWDSGGFTCHQQILNAPGFDKSTPYAKVFLDSMKIVKDFWAEPSYAQLLLAMQNRVHDYVVAGKGTPNAALDALVKDWSEVFKEDGKVK
ncbi:ABC transporter substrate-binding protein [Ramlibacter albus]|uniref:Carbohydrate ABC transporter substrate-binding protein n=1 Tax=Ramlibacter albus TaxID=2079448 RepID=A0A923MA73_9BURK|nr:ABC transporter substrate-binding protein [Ramlibacter albus]MBC5767142.1 carbohydrate ABC transporter substrate-binding protein [Ramlibacter albus]